jgi:chromosome segregation ATPase
MLNRATKIMNKQREEREAAANKCYATISDAQEALKVLGFEVVSADEVIDVTPITINKGQIVKVEVETKDEELQKAYDELKAEYSALRNSYGELDEAYEILANDLANRNDRIEDLKITIDDLNDELEIKEGVLNHMKKVHKCEIEELEDKIKELNRRIKTLQMFNDAEDEIFEEQEIIKGGDAVKAQPEQPKRNPLLDKIKKAKEFTLEEAVAEAQAEAEQKAKDKEEAKSKFPKYTLEYHELTFDKSIDSNS